MTIALEKKRPTVRYAAIVREAALNDQGRSEIVTPATAAPAQMSENGTMKRSWTAKIRR